MPTFELSDDEVQLIINALAMSHQTIRKITEQWNAQKRSVSESEWLPRSVPRQGDGKDGAVGSAP